MKKIRFRKGRMRKLFPRFKGYRLRNYEEFLKWINEERVNCLLMNNYFEKENISEKHINLFIRHDVDFGLKKLERMIKLEKKYHVRSTIFIRLCSKQYHFMKNVNYFQQLEKEGFELGYHYETMAQTKGIKILAIDKFIFELYFMRNYLDIQTVSAHGDRYNNRIIWKYLEKEKLGINSAYEIRSDCYLSDSGGEPFEERYGCHIFDKVREAKKGGIVQILLHPGWWIK